MATARSGAGRFVSFSLGVLLALVLTVGGVWAYLRWGHPPVAVADKPFPYEEQIAHTALDARIAREIKTPPFAASEDAYERGARVYAEDCAFCHGTPGQESPYGTAMYPAAPQLWVKHRNSAVVGVSDDPVGETYWKIAHGIRLSGMPQYGDSLSDSEMWDVALLLKAADQPLPEPVTKAICN